MLIVNPYATAVSDRLRSLVVHALGTRYAVTTIDTERRDHATALSREAAAEGYDVVVAFGGDGTVNEVANGLVGSATPLSCLPGGSANVFCRILGIPADVVEATEHLLQVADDFHPRRVDVGVVGTRRFLFSSGAGLDASVVKHVDSRARLKRRLGAYYFGYVAIARFSRDYLLRAPRLRVEIGDRRVEGITLIVQNADPFTYFRERPIRVCAGAGLETGTLAAALLKRAGPLTLPTLTARLLSGRASAVGRHSRIEGLSRASQIGVAGVAGRPFPLQVDGDYIGMFDEVAFSVEPRALAVVA